MSVMRIMTSDENSVGETNDQLNVKLKLHCYEAEYAKKLKEKEQNLGRNFNIIGMHIKTT